MYHKKNVDFAYLMWEDFVYQVEHKDAKKSNEMYYPRFTKVIVNFFMTKDQSIPRRNKEYYAISSGAEPPKSKASVKKKQVRSNTTMPPSTAKGKRIKTSAKVALTEAEQMKLATKRSLIQTHISHDSGSRAYKGTVSIPGVLDVPTYESDHEQISWKSSEKDNDEEVNMSKHVDDVDDQSDDDNQDDDDEQTNSDNDIDDFVHPNFSTLDDEDKEDESFNLRVQTPSHVETTDDEDNDENSQGVNVEGDELDEKEANEEDEEDTHVIITPVNTEGQQQSSSVSSGFVSNMLNPSPYTDEDEQPSAGSNRGSKRRRAGKEPESTSAPKEKISMSTRKSTEGSKSHHNSAPAKEPMHTTEDLEEPTHQEFITVEWDNYKHVDWITVRRDDDKLYKFKEGNFNRLCIQDIEYMLLLLVQGKLINLTITERLAFNVFLRMFIRSIFIQRRVEDQQLGIESYRKKINLTKPDTYRSDLKRIEAYTTYANPRGLIYQNKDKKNRLMCIDELHKFSDNTLNDVRTSLDDRLKGIQMQYLPQTIWRRSDKDKAGAIIQAIDKQLKTRRIMPSLEKFVSGRLYEGDLRLL
nr:hypothetical protein [Tanacetum cinerariifolium]